MRINSLTAMLMTTVFVLTLGGCSTVFTVPESGEQRINVTERDFSAALQLLRSGNEEKAVEQFEKVVAAPVVPGVTDEALFRLSVLLLRDNNLKNVQRAGKLLDRLENEFPGSIWRYQSGPLVSYMEEAADMRRNLRDLKAMKDQNNSLIRSNRELRQTIEKLKEMDIELEYRKKR